jgi:hypothetical protein
MSESDARLAEKLRSTQREVSRGERQQDQRVKRRDDAVAEAIAAGWTYARIARENTMLSASRIGQIARERFGAERRQPGRPRNYRTDEG